MKKIGIVGGGQLGRMFFQEAINFDVECHFLDGDKNAPCSSISPNFVNGSILDFDQVYAFGKNKDVVSIEIENVNVEALKKLEAEGIKVFPQPHIIEMIQDKGLQKEFYRDHGIPTADFFLVNNRNEISNYVSEIPFMQKMRKGGYDGKGVTPIKHEDDVAGGFDVPSVLEKFVDFDKEISVIVARNEKGQVNSFPVVECEFNPEANLVEFLFSPADVSQTIEKEACQIAEDLIKKLEMVGILAVEMFLTKEGKVLVNEIAPRPHNSGHQTIEGNVTSQYEQHLRSIIGLPLGDTSITLPSVMINLLGEKGFEGPVVYDKLDEVTAISGVKPHIYGKKETKPFRKMGHITIIDKDLEKAKEKARFVKETIKVIAK
ncbi:MAG: 5-(carboxyamino)imidazole ribonucleotide synthase [Crocinitomicaceae bacterium]|nr:5-(carboxyamino)imidazole ribonucleotide synthase [Crocinitomicaceae bacterium]